MIAGIWADKFDQLAGFQNFFIMPLTMLSGVFYSIHSLPAFWQRVSHFNPFYMIDGFRFGFSAFLTPPRNESGGRYCKFCCCSNCAGDVAQRIQVEVLNHDAI